MSPMPGLRTKNSQLSNRYEFLACGRQDFAPTLRNYDHVFDANAPTARDVHAGLDGNHHSLAQDLGLSRCNAWSLVNLQAYTMPGRVREVCR